MDYENIDEMVKYREITPDDITQEDKESGDELSDKRPQ